MNVIQKVKTERTIDYNRRTAMRAVCIPKILTFQLCLMVNSFRVIIRTISIANAIIVCVY
jgi:hypothetical protein